MPAVRVLFWNVSGAEQPWHLAAIVKSHEPDIIILAESACSPASTVEIINQVSKGGYVLPLNYSNKLQFFARAAIPFSALHDGYGVAIRHVRPYLSEDLSLVAVHLPSKLHLTSDDQAQLITRLKQVVDHAERQVGHQRTIIIGDLNMDPFESGVVGSEGLHAVMSRSLAIQRSRTVLGEERSFFYNPMWSLLGDMSVGPPGTYFRRGSAPIEYFWHMFDQVLVRPDIAELIRPGDVEVLFAAGDRDLLNSRGVPDISVSDHLPVCATVRLQEVIR